MHSTMAPRIPSQPRRKVEPWLLLVIVAVGIAAAGILGGDVPRTHSFAPNMIWVHEWAEQVRNGVLYPRWTEHSYAGLGSPTFHFYGPWSLYMALPFTLGLGLSASRGVMGSSLLALFVLGFGVTHLTRQLCETKHRWVGGVLGALTVLSTYPLVCVFRRGALAEVWAMAVLPWMLAALFRSASNSDLRSRFPLVITAALFGLCHPPTLLLGFLAIGVAVFVTSTSWRRVLLWVRRGLLPMGAAMALDGIYLVSALLDQKHVKIDQLNLASDNLPINRLLAGRLGQASTTMAEGFDAEIVPGFIAGCVIVALAAWLLWRRRGSPGVVPLRHALFLLCMAAISALMMTDLGRGIYKLLPVLDRIQFSWRWMAVFTVVIMPLWGFVLVSLAEERGRNRRVLRTLTVLGTLALVSMTYGAATASVQWDKDLARRVNRLLNKANREGHTIDAVAPLQDVNGGLFHLNGKGELLYLDVKEYQVTARTEWSYPTRVYPAVEWASGNGAFSNVEWRNGIRRFSVDSPAGGEVLVRTSAWPGWDATVNGEHQSAERAGEGSRIQLSVPAGHSDVAIRYAGTRAQRFGTALSLATIVLLLGAYGWTTERGRRLLAWLPRRAFARWLPRDARVPAPSGAVEVSAPALEGLERRAPADEPARFEAHRDHAQQE